MYFGGYDSASLCLTAVTSRSRLVEHSAKAPFPAHLGTLFGLHGFERMCQALIGGMTQPIETPDDQGVAFP